MALNNHPRVGDYDLRSLMMAISGAGPLPLEVQNRFEEITGSIIIEGYGLSEAAPVTHANPLDRKLRKVGAIGLPLPDTDMRIVDKETCSHVLSPMPFAVGASGGLSPEQSAVEQERQERLVDAILGLSDQQQKVLNLYYYEELTLKEIGAVLGVSESRICQIHGAAMKKLRNLMRED